MPVGEEQDVSSSVGVDLGAELARAHLHLGVQSYFNQSGKKSNRKFKNIYQLAKFIFVCSVEKLCSVVSIFKLLWMLIVLRKEGEDPPAQCR